MIKIFYAAGTVTFSIGGEAESPGPTESGPTNEAGNWNCVWKCRTATPVHLMSFSPDGTLFATTGMNDRLVKIWFENKQREFLFIYYQSSFQDKNLIIISTIHFQYSHLRAWTIRPSASQLMIVTVLFMLLILEL